MTAPSLIERLEGAERGGWELDAEIADLFPPTSLDEALAARNVTTSLDAALALAERVLGETFRLGLIQQPDGSWEAATLWVDLDDRDPDDREVEFGVAHTPALALCAAILKARKDTL